MTLLGVIIIAVLIGMHVVALLIGHLNLRAAHLPLPDAVADLYPPDRLQRMRRYQKDRFRLHAVADSLYLAILIAFWMGGGFSALDNALRAIGLSSVPLGLVYIGVLGFGAWLLAIPFSLADTFGIESKYGFNTTGVRTFWLDQFKGLLMSAIIGGALLTGIFLFFQYAGIHAWWMCWVFAAACMVLLHIVAPIWILPLFNRFEPLTGDLEHALTAYAKKVGYSVSRVMTMDGSRRSTKANAFFTGIGRHRRIVLFDTLVATHPTEAILAILGHEMGHAKLGHIRTMVMIGIVRLGGLFGVMALCLHQPAMFKALGVATPSIHIGLVAFALLMQPAGKVLGIGAHALSRRFEYAADRFAIATTGHGEALATALKQMTTDHLNHPQPHPAYVFFHYSHPPLANRLEALDREAAHRSSR